jgi:hypothetical protein
MTCKMIVYDNRDAKDPRLQEIVFRLLDSTNAIVVQRRIPDDTWIDRVRQVATFLGAEYRYVGPPQHVLGGTPAKPSSTLDTGQPYAVAEPPAAAASAPVQKTFF